MRSTGDSVTELDSATGALVQVLKGSRYRFNSPESLSSDGNHVWVTNPNSQSLTSFPA